MVPHSSLFVVLSELMLKPFEPLTTCPEAILYIKVCFSGHYFYQEDQWNGLLHMDPVFHKVFSERMVFGPAFSSYPKRWQGFITFKRLYYQCFSLYQNLRMNYLHTLDVRRALLLYLKRTLTFRKDEVHFLCFSGSNKGKRTLSKTLPRWTVAMIRACPGSLFKKWTRRFFSLYQGMRAFHAMLSCLLESLCGIT